MTAASTRQWALCFEEPESRTLWLGKATPRDWLAPGEAPLQARGLTTRYGRLDLRYVARLDPHGTYRVLVNLTLPHTITSRPPTGGIRVRIRAPPPYAGTLAHATVGGAAWVHVDAAAETVDFGAAQLTAEVVRGAGAIVATFTRPPLATVNTPLY